MQNVIKLEKLIITHRTWRWCQLSYPGHPKGCQNYGKKQGCPPDVSMIDEVLDMEKPYYFIYSEFDLAAHEKRMKEKHPKWSDKQARCVLYWQGAARKKLRRAIRDFYLNCKDIINSSGVRYPHMIWECPEAYGVNVYATAAAHGLKLERIKGLKICRHVALVGRNKN